MEPTQTNPTPQEPKKSFWAKLFGGGKKQDTTPQPPQIVPPTAQAPSPQVNDSSFATNIPTGTPEPVETNNLHITPATQPTPEVSPEDANAVDAALSALPEVPSQPPINATPPPVPPSDPMVTPAPTPSQDIPQTPVNPPSSPLPPPDPIAPPSAPTQPQPDENTQNRPPQAPLEG